MAKASESAKFDFQSIYENKKYTVIVFDPPKAHFCGYRSTWSSHRHYFWINKFDKSASIVSKLRNSFDASASFSHTEDTKVKPRI